ncbi:hypothetical protein G7Z17_g2077 [Cylindrodendrum hubeiense]|uniref:Uncharacterized protein n=1 Tax=Cylindrodendrum hubeiense TaxID=595255 RepID=A0A9P5HHA8_9HYPO|nr:hypothetical protein G7Z17_g2077 [Cylindrodendrum hubeiense]
MFSSRLTLAARSTGRSAITAQGFPVIRTFATASPVTVAAKNHKVVVVGGGTAGLAISHQLLRSGKFAQDDIAVVDPAEWHDYQPGFTLAAAGLKNKEDLRKPMRTLIDRKLKFYNDSVGTFSPDDNFITLANGDKVSYDQLVVVPGIKVDFSSIKGLPEALADPNSHVCSIYGYETCDKVFRSMKKFRKGTALFTQPTGIVKCAGAPQKTMWLALDYWKRAGLYDATSKSPIDISFATGIPTMFGVPKYSATLEVLRKERGVEGLFQHDLLSINGNTATFVRGDGKGEVKKHFDFLHVVPKMGPHAFVKNSALANEAGLVDVDAFTTRHNSYQNVWSAGDASGLPTSKTMAAITSQAPVLVRNLLRSLDGKELDPAYDGYTSCPLVTEYGKVLLAEFKYGGEPKETFNTAERRVLHPDGPAEWGVLHPGGPPGWGNLVHINQYRISVLPFKKPISFATVNMSTQVLLIPVTRAENNEQRRNSSNVRYPFWFGGSASSMAACVTHPLDLIKVRLQTRKPGTPKGMARTIAKIYKTDGPLGFYSGISASLLRQLTYSTIRFGIYEDMKHRAGPNPSFPLLVAMASSSGFIGGMAGNVGDVLNIRMQQDAALPMHERRNYKHAIDGMIRMTKEEGISSWFRGWLPNCSRAAVTTAGQLASYDAAKRMLIQYTPMEDTLATQLLASLLAGLVAATVTSPIDVIKTRVMLSTEKQGIVTFIKNISRTEGAGWMFKGWVPSFLRLGPYTICTFLFLELHRKTYKKFQE